MVGYSFLPAGAPLLLALCPPSGGGSEARAVQGSDPTAQRCCPSGLPAPPPPCDLWVRRDPGFRCGHVPRETPGCGGTRVPGESASFTSARGLPWGFLGSSGLSVADLLLFFFNFTASGRISEPGVFDSLAAWRRKRVFSPLPTLCPPHRECDVSSRY